MTSEEIRAFFGGHSESSEWYDITDPLLVMNMPIVDISSADRLRDRKEMKRVHQYIAKFKNQQGEFIVRFTVKENIGGTQPRAEVHASVISRISIYKTKGAELSTPIKTRAEDPAPFVDNKIALFLSAVNGVK